MPKIMICGLNGAGKSTLGKALADKTGWTFKDVVDTGATVDIQHISSGHSVEVVRLAKRLGRCV